MSIKTAEKSSHLPKKIPFAEKYITYTRHFPQYDPKRSILALTTPDDFLHLVAPLGVDEDDSIKRLTERMIKGKEIDIPYLIINKEGTVMGGEGRHRSIAAKKLGIKKIPVFIRFERHVVYRDPEMPNGIDYKTINMLDRPQEDLVRKIDMYQKTRAELPKFCSRKKSNPNVIVCRLKSEYDYKRPQTTKTYEFDMGNIVKWIADPKDMEK